MKHSYTQTAKHYIMFFVALIATYTEQAQSSSLVPAVLVHNQQEGITESLNPFLNAGIHEFLLCGNASDSTMDIAYRFLTSSGARVATDGAKFDTDSQYYTHIHTTIKTLFPDAQFGLIFNGQWLTHNVNKLLEFCTVVKDEHEPVYWVKLSTHGIDEESYSPALVRCNGQAEFEGVINPVPKKCLVKKVPSDVYFWWDRILWGIDSTRQQLLDDKERLLEAYKKNPQDPHTLFTLAATYETLNDLRGAYHFYMLRNTVHAGTEEDYLAAYKLGLLLEKVLGAKCDWQMQYNYYIKAHELRPWRAEPLVKIAQHYLHESNNELAFIFSRQASQLPYPAQDTQLIEPHAYDLSPNDILGITGWYLQEFEVGEEALRKALHSQPSNNHLSANLDFYVNRKESTGTKAHKKDSRIPAGFGVDFHDSMKHGYTYDYNTIENDPFLQKIRIVYEKYAINDVEFADTPRIPKIIHQIWLGSELPDRYKAWRSTWFKNNPDWQYKLWTQKDIDELGLKNKAQFDAARTYGEKSDIARYEILDKFGGVYCDTDFECIQPMDVFHHCCDFYAGLEGLVYAIGNSIIGSAPGHPIMKRCIALLRSAEKGKEGWEYVVARTGPGYLTNCIKAEMMCDGIPESRIVIFPACYFFPWHRMRQSRPITTVFKDLRPETFALHLWESSWVK